MKLFNLDIERAILNSILSDNTAFDKINHILNANDFYLPFHQVVFETIKKLLKEKDFIDEYIVKDELEKEKNLMKNYF